MCRKKNGKFLFFIPSICSCWSNTSFLISYLSPRINRVALYFYRLSVTVGLSLFLFLIQSFTLCLFLYFYIYIYIYSCFSARGLNPGRVSISEIKEILFMTRCEWNGAAVVKRGGCSYCSGGSAVPKGKSREMGIRVVYKCFFPSFSFFPAISVSLAPPSLLLLLYQKCALVVYVKYVYIYINPAQKMDGMVVMVMCGGGIGRGACGKYIAFRTLQRRHRSLTKNGSIVVLLRVSLNKLWPKTQAD